ncbi:uncharacterized protein [Littorina saxatilis]|uniref:uncharacterized protein n=1 Tax=Littorina saxatilis TaxID=31220 RepID=UPI0038B50EEE
MEEMMVPLHEHDADEIESGRTEENSDSSEWDHFLNRLNEVESVEENLDHQSDSDTDSDIESVFDPVDKTEELGGELAAWSSKWKVKANAFTALLTLLNVYFPRLPKDSRTVMKTPRSLDVKEIGGGSYFHFGIVAMLTNIVPAFSHLVLRGTRLLIQVNIDGLPLFKSSGIQLWPILGRVCQPFQSEPFVIGLFCGKQKPTILGEYLDDFVSEMGQLQRGPIDVGLGDPVNDVNIACFICDAPARAFIKQVKGHSGYYGCEKCKQKGSWEGRVVFTCTSIDAPKRENEDFRVRAELRDTNHQIGVSPLLRLSLGMVSQFPLDYMHLVCLGVVKRLLSYLIKSPVQKGLRLGSAVIVEISQCLKSIREYLPREFNRKCRSLDELDRWKATEFRQFMLYSGVVAMKGRLKDVFY